MAHGHRRRRIEEDDDIAVRPIGGDAAVINIVAFILNVAVAIWNASRL